MRRSDRHSPLSIAVYPGSFDPITNGHLNVLERALTLFDHVVVLVASNPKKPGGLFSVGERMALIAASTSHLGDATRPLRSPSTSDEWPKARLTWETTVSRLTANFFPLDGLFQAHDPSSSYAQADFCTDQITVAWLKSAATVDFCEAVGGRAMIRGLRSVTDFDQEFELAVANMELAEHVETVFLVPRPENHFVSSSKVREIFSLRGAEAVARYVPSPVQAALRTKEAGETGREGQKT